MIEITEEQREVLKLAIEIYGTSNQIDKCIEEMAELTQALLKYRHSPSMLSSAHVHEELADVKIMVEQMFMIFGEDVMGYSIDYKIKRLAQRLHKEV